jgi:hypothetical protein
MLRTSKVILLTVVIIILIDDRKKNLKEVGKYLEEFYPHIQFVGIEYQGAAGYAPQDISATDFRAFWESLARQAKTLGHNATMSLKDTGGKEKRSEDGN